MKKLLVLVLTMAMVISFGIIANAQEILEEEIPETLTEENAAAKVGDTLYLTIDEAIANWKNNTTLTLLSDVTLSDVVILNSTEHHILNLGTYSLTAASGKNAFEIKACGTGSSERTAITINADKDNPGSINAPSKSIVYYNYSNGGISAEDRPVIKINGGIFNAATSGTAGIYTKGGTAARKAATLNISGGTFNCTINGQSKSKLIITGGTFNYSVGSQGDSTANRLISGGKFKTLGFMTADSKNTKFWFGTSMGNSNVGVYIDREGYLVVGGAVITEAGDRFEARDTNCSKWNSLLQYSSAKQYGLYYESATVALKKNTTGTIDIYSEEVDLISASSFKGTLHIAGDQEILTVAYKKGIAPSWKVTTCVDGKIVNYFEIEMSTFALTDSQESIIARNYTVYGSLIEAIENAYDGDTITLSEDITLSDEIVINKNITLDLGGNTITSTSKSAIKVHSDATIKNGTINGARTCINTREAVELTLDGLTLNSTGYTEEYRNPQIITIGGTENGTVVTMNNVTLNATNAGYGIITFVETDLTATNCDFNGYNSIYIKEGSDGSEFNFIGCTLESDISNNDVAGNGFGAIVVTTDNINISLDSTSTISAVGNNTVALSLGVSEQPYVSNVTLNSSAKVNGNVLKAGKIESNTVTLPSDCADTLLENGFGYTENDDGTITAEELKDDSSQAPSVPEEEMFITFKGFSYSLEDGRLTAAYTIDHEKLAAYVSENGYTSYDFGTTFAINSIDENALELSLSSYRPTKNYFVFVNGIEEEYYDVNIIACMYVTFDGEKKYVTGVRGKTAFVSASEMSATTFNKVLGGNVQ